MKKSKKSDAQTLNVMEWIENNPLTEDQSDALKAALSISPTHQFWRGQSIIPPRTMLDTVVEVFKKTTDFPLELPAILTLHAIAAYLLDKGCRISVAGTEMRPDLWTVILAASGAGKTLTTDVLTSVIPLRMMPETTSAAKFLSELAENNRGAWFQDEWAQVMKRIDTQAYAEEMRDYLLRTYDNRSISRNTVKSTITVEDPALVIVGTTVTESFLENISLESMLDGFMQRFQYVIGDPDPTRTPDMFPIYRTRRRVYLARIERAFAKISKRRLHEVYRVDAKGEEAFSETFRQLFEENRAMPASFFRRVMWRSIKYALVYHVLLGKRSAIIDAEDLGWAARVSALHLIDARRLLDNYHMSELEAVVRKAEALQEKLGRKPKPRELVSGIRAIKTASMAHAIIGLMGDVGSAQPLLKAA